MTYVNEMFRKRINQKNIRRLQNRDFSVIASNCNGGVMLHDLGLQFKSPFVNLWIGPKDFIKMLKNLDEYLEYELEFEKGKENYPIGILRDIRIHFLHFNSEKEAKEKWNERLKRINRNNLFILFTDRDGCTYEDLIEFDNLPYENKIVFTSKEYPDIMSAVYFKRFKNQKSVGICSEFINKISGKRIYDKFDWVEWFNSGNKQG